MVKLDFSGSVMLVTGAGQGNGEAIARGFARAGGRVILADRNADSAKRAAQAIRDGGGDARAYELDVSDAAACSRLAERVRAEAGDVKVLVNNAGILIRAPFGQGKPLQDWDATLRVNLGGPYYMALAFADQLERTKGCILNVGSIQSFVATPNSAAYTASKGGVAQLTKALACEFARRGVRVNAIAPGVIATPMTESTRSDPAKMAALLAHIPMKRYAQPDELIGPALFLCSDLASYVTGTILPVDGGYLAN